MNISQQYKYERKIRDRYNELSKRINTARTKGKGVRLSREDVLVLTLDWVYSHPYESPRDADDRHHKHVQETIKLLYPDEFKND